jgi:hypothetical protein
VERLMEAPQVSEANLRTQHHIVVDLNRRVNPILPARFGALVELDELDRLISMRRGRFLKAFDCVRGADQMTIRVRGPAGTPHLPRRSGSASGTEYLRARRAAVRPYFPPEAELIRQAVQPLVTAERVDAARGSVGSTLSHLVPRAHHDRYIARLDEVAMQLPATSHVSVSGPWPPFAFVPELWA